MFHRCLAGRPYSRDIRNTQQSPSVLTLRILVMCKAYATLRRMLSRELSVKIFLSSITWVFTHSLYHIILTIKAYNKYRVQHIEWNYNKIWHEIKPARHIVVNYNFIISIIPNKLELELVSYKAKTNWIANRLELK